MLRDAPPPADAQKRRAYDHLKSAAPETTAAMLWPRIVARTDQIYETVEDLLPVFQVAVRALASKVGLADGDLMFAPGLKDPVRLHEKAMDDYVLDFDDWDDAKVIPESCVIDPIRGSALCSDGGPIFRLPEELDRGFETEVDGKTARLTLLRCKNKFANGGKSVPTRFRNVLTNIILQYDGRRVFTELQIHHRAIKEFNEASHAHDPYARRPRFDPGSGCTDAPCAHH